MQPQPVFDAAAARADGVPDSDIAAFLAPRMNFDLEAARKDGVPDSNIVNFLAPPKTAPEPAPQPAPAPSLTDRIGSALKANAEAPTATHAFAAGFGEGFQEGAPVGEPYTEVHKAFAETARRTGIAPTTANMGAFDRLTGTLMNKLAGHIVGTGAEAINLTSRVFEGLVKGGQDAGAQVLKNFGVEAQQANDIARDALGPLEIEAGRGGEIPFHEAAATARHFAPENVLRSAASQTPKATPADVMAAPDIDTAIARASEAAHAEPQDIEAEGMKAEAAARAVEQAAPAPVAAETPAVEPTVPEAAKPASAAPVTAENTQNTQGPNTQNTQNTQIPTAETEAPPHEEIPLAEAPPEEEAPEQFDRLKYLTQARSYVIKGKGSLKPDAVAEALGIEPEQAAQVMGALAAQRDSGLIVTANGTLRRSPTYSGPQDLVQWIGRNGGIARDSDMEAMDAHRTLISGGGPLARNTGRDADYVREAVNQEGYGPYQTINELYAAIDDNLRGNRQFRTGEAPEERGYDETEHEQYLDQRGAALGLERNPAWTLPEYDAAITEAEARRTPTHTLSEVDTARQAEMDRAAVDEISRGLLDPEGLEEFLGHRTAAATRTGDTGEHREGAQAPGPEPIRPDETGSPRPQTESRAPDVAASGAASGTGEAGSVAAPKFALSDKDETPAPPFFSALTRAVESSKQEKAAPGQWLAQIKNTPGVKAEELEWSGVGDWLNSHAKPVSKAELLDYLKAHEVDVREVVKKQPEAGFTDAFDKIEQWARNNASLPDRDRERLFRVMVDANDADPALPERLAHLGVPEELIAPVRQSGAAERNNTKFGSYALPGGQPGSYRELLLTLPEKKSDALTKNWQAERVGMDGLWRVTDANGQPIWAGIRAADRSTAVNIAAERMGWASSLLHEGDNFRSSHWDEPNVLAHVRFDDRTGPNGEKILHVAEIQSDFGQQLRRVRQAQSAAVDNDFQGIIERMKKAGALVEDCS